MKRIIYVKIILWGVVLIQFGCERAIEIRIPPKIVATEKVFSNYEDANSAVMGLYYSLGERGVNFSSAGSGLFGGLSADDLQPFDQGLPQYAEFFTNNLTQNNPLISGTFWTPAYNVIYSASAIITGVGNSSGLSSNNKDSLIASAKFARAYCYWYLLNFFGEVPLVTSINYKQTSLLSRSGTEELFQFILNDLEFAVKFLPLNYLDGKRILPTQWAARALLARVYLYTGKWQQAIDDADIILNNHDLFELSPDLTKVFTADNREAIWQLSSNPKSPVGNVTDDGKLYIPYPNPAQSLPSYCLTENLIMVFDTSDRRLKDWTVVNTYMAGSYRIPYKYKDGRAQLSAGAIPREYNTVFRLAELYLIRAEAMIQLGRTEESAAGLNVIRMRAGLEPINTQSKDSLLYYLYNERRKEYFAEGAHRWFDLKRWGLADKTLGSLKGTNWQSTDQLYPIPESDLFLAPNLTQNTGY